MVGADTRLHGANNDAMSDASTNTVIFACVHSAGRSQMAAGWFNSLVGSGKARAIAAGTQPSEHVHPVVLEAMQEVGIDLSQAKPQLLTSEMMKGASCVITMGCGESCPVGPPGIPREDWELEDPKGQPIEHVRKIRDRIKRLVSALLERQRWT
jgi:arsenate reductase (thioredoxin)